MSVSDSVNSYAQSRRSRRTTGVLLLTCMALISACASSNGDEPMAATIQITDQWASAGDAGMAALFGTVTNTGDRNAHAVSGTSPVAGRVEIHEVTNASDGTKTMSPKPNGLMITAGASHELAPGGDHLMLMDLREPLHPGDDVTVQLVFEDGSQLPVTAQVRDFAGADAEYSGHQPTPHPVQEPHDHG